MSKETLKITLVQSHLVWENPAANRAAFDNHLKSITETDVVVLPEMFTTGFTMNAQQVAEPTNGITFSWMQNWAKQLDCAITGSVVVEDDGAFYNRLFFVYPNGESKYYDKKHLFTLANEHKTYNGGTERLILEYLGWKICPLICYDLRFPVWARNTDKYDVLIYTANWPQVRTSAWDALLKARAIENMSYCIGVNRIGKDGNGYEHSGHSAVYDCLGELISTSDMEIPLVQTITLSKEHILKTREKLRFLEDMDHFTLM